MSNYPFIGKLEEFIKKDDTRMFVPGHKGNFEDVGPLGKIGKYDLTELPETDSLFEASGIIEELEERITELYGSKKSYISCAGSTLGIQTMLSLVLSEGDKVIMPRNVHVSAVHTAALIGFEPIWVYTSERNGIPKQIKPDAIKKALEDNREAKAVYITSPDYYGMCADIEEISRICKMNGVALLVDAAHGSHLNFTYKKYAALLNGADMCVESLHKTMPCLTGSAVLHINNEEYDVDVKDRMSLFASTSPSYLMMESIDYAVSYMNSGGKSDYAALSSYIYKLKLELKDMGYDVIINESDPMRITLSAFDIGYNGAEFEEYLRSKGIIPEMISADYAVLIPTPFNSKKDFEKLENALKNLPTKGASQSYTTDIVSFMRPNKKVCEIREAMLSSGTRIDVQNAVGRVSGETCFTCPPGIPVLVPGEEISENLVKLLIDSGIYNVKVVK